MKATALLHLRAPVYEVHHNGRPVFMLQLIERVGHAYGSRVDVLCDSELADTFVRTHRADLKPGTSLFVDLQDMHALDNVMRARLSSVPRIAPPRLPGAAAPSTTTRAAQEPA